MVFNAAKVGGDDKHCVIEARLEGMQPVSASDSAQQVAAAVTGAARKLRRVLKTTLGKKQC